MRYDRHRRVPGHVAAAAIALVVALALPSCNYESCEDKGGTIIQVGWEQETYLYMTIKVGEVSVPIYSTRTVPTYDCVGEE